ncbi:hypothetical protein RFI_15933 [Reticulomyxa filosa]|uniref:non-specific serine/threonine protein kinase n=1 Tax=Reticulomyxa filosa TaxID=46433 RepID=X6N5H8_RETFI|nr:hypothetical protein RFI_15933 [Reticulomyxa filosa]|eukprot:ETO21271.1 hypothetical protein RFI_15933 [Reticulomyxa filosa]
MTFRKLENITVKFAGGLQRCQKKEFIKFVNQDNKQYISTEALDLTDRLLRYDHQDRLSPREAMKHPYFDPVHEYKRKNPQFGSNTSKEGEQNTTTDKNNSNTQTAGHSTKENQNDQ